MYIVHTSTEYVGTGTEYERCTAHIHVVCRYEHVGDIHYAKSSVTAREMDALLALAEIAHL